MVEWLTTRAVAALFVFAAAGAALPLAPNASAAEADQPGLTQPQQANVAGVVADIIECRRADGFLTVRVRFKNTTDKELRVPVIASRNFHQYYVTAGAKKYLIVEDSERTPLASPATGGGDINPQIAKGGSWVWWAKYTAPPPEVKQISYYTPLTPPFENVPVTD